MALIDEVIVVREKLTAIGKAIREKTNSTEELTLGQMASKIKGIHDSLIEDVPTTPGQWACLARASQMRDLNYVVKGDVLTYVGELYGVTYDGVLVSRGEILDGIWYSSVRGTDWGFIGYAVSMYSFMTCLNNPKSFVYTKKYHDYFSDNFAGGNVYGTNCTEYVSYCHDLPYLTVTDRLPYLTCMCDENGTHNMNGMCWDSVKSVVDTEKLRTELKLCDILNSAEEWNGTAGHAVIVTGIRRNADGVIQEVDISESTVPIIICTTYSWDSFVSKFIKGSGYRPYRVSTLEKVTFPENLTNIVYSDIVTNRGDKVSIRPNQDISLNVLGSGYSGIVLFKDGVQISTQASTEDWALTDLTTGKYTAILYRTGETVTIEDANEHNSTSFIVCNVSVSRNGNTFSYAAEAIDGVYPKPMQIAVKSNTGFTLDTLVLDIDDFNGSSTSTFEMNADASANGVIYHMPFKTEYGFVIAEYKD